MLRRVIADLGNLASYDAMASPGLHRPGVLARVSGLEATPALNGEVGKLLRLTEEGRWVVQTGAGLSAIRSENLSPAADVVPESLRRLVACAAAVTANLFLELARSGGSRRVTAAAVPVLLAVWAFATLYGARWLHRPLAWQEFPLPGLWELGSAPPSQGVFRGGCATAAMLLTCLVRLHQNLILKPVFIDKEQLSAALQSTPAGYVAALGLVLQSLELYTSVLLTPGLRDFMGSVLFLGGSAWHAKTFLVVSAELSQSAFAQSTVFCMMLSMRRLLVMCAPIVASNASMVIPIFQLKSLPAGDDKRQSNQQTLRLRLKGSIAICQWVLTCYFMLYFSTYAIDFYIAFDY